MVVPLTPSLHVLTHRGLLFLIRSHRLQRIAGFTDDLPEIDGADAVQHLDELGFLFAGRCWAGFILAALMSERATVSRYMI